MPPPVPDPWDTGTIGPRRFATPIGVYRYTPGHPTDEFVPLPNLQAITIERREGPEPSIAAFRYDWSYALVDPAAPATPEQAMSTAFTSALTVNVADRLVVIATRPDTQTEYLFDGHALRWHVHSVGQGEDVTITAIGVERRCRRDPIGGILLRDASDVENGDDADTDLPARFNPRGIGNATPEDMDSGPSGDPDAQYPVFIDPDPIAGTANPARRWTLPMSARYLLHLNDPATSFVKHPEGTELDLLLVVKTPYGDDPFDPDDPGTYNAKPIITPDTPLTGRDWPTTLHDLIADYGFGMRWTLGKDISGKPETRLELYHRQAGDLRPLRQQARGGALDRSGTNAVAFDAQRDLADVANDWTVEGALVRREASFVLAPGFEPAASDASSATNIAAFDQSSPSFPTNRNKYRVYVLDEAGEGHWDFGTAATETDPPDLETVLGTDYAVRRRKPLGELLTNGPDDKPLRASLAVSTNYAGDKPGVWDGTGTWQPIEGGWQLLPSRIGIRVTATNPNSWKIGASLETTAPYPSGVIKGVEAIAAAGATRFHLRLTCVVEGDRTCRGEAPRRSASPVTETIKRTVDARDRYRHDLVVEHSEHNDDDDPITIRSDLDTAEAEAEAIRATAEMGLMTGSALIDHITTLYKIGDRVTGVEVRGMTFRTDALTEGEAPTYPAVTAIRWTLWPDQTTLIQFSDAGSRLGDFRYPITQGSRRRAR